MSRHKPYKGPAVTVTFEDHFQDFLEWDVRDGKVVACRPFQASLWCGLEVHSKPEVGYQLRIRNRLGTLTFIKYPVADVTPIRQVKAGEVSEFVLNSKVIARGAQGLLADLQRRHTP